MNSIKKEAPFNIPFIYKLRWYHSQKQIKIDFQLSRAFVYDTATSSSYDVYQKKKRFPKQKGVEEDQMKKITK